MCIHLYRMRIYVRICVLYTHEHMHAYVRRGIATYEKTGVRTPTASSVSTLVLFIYYRCIPHLSVMVDRASYTQPSYSFQGNI